MQGRISQIVGNELNSANEQQGLGVAVLVLVLIISPVIICVVTIMKFGGFSVHRIDSDNAILRMTWKVVLCLVLSPVISHVITVIKFG